MVEVRDAVDETFEDPEEFCSRIAFFGFVRFGLAWLTGVFFALTFASVLMLILVRSVAGDSPGTQVWARQAVLGLAAASVVVAVVWVVFEAVMGVLFGVGVDLLPFGTSGAMIGVGARDFVSHLPWLRPGPAG